MSVRKKTIRKLPAIPDLTPAEIAAHRPKVLRGIRDIEEGRYKDFDEKGLLELPRLLVAESLKRLSRRKTA
jgi:hypothetical protein